MASFRERYEELFGPTPDYDPIKIEGVAKSGQRRALNIQKDVGTEPTFHLPTMPAKAIDPEQGVLGNIGDLTKTGGAMLGEAVLGVAEYGARQLGRNEFEGVRKTFDATAGGLEDARGFLADYRQKVYDSMPQDAVAKKGAEFLTLDPDKTIWKGNPLDVGEAILYKFWESVPMMAATLIPGAVMMRAGMSAKGISYLGASEGALSVGFIANEITDGIQEMDDETLAQESPRFAELLAERNDPVSARKQLIAEAQGMAPIIGGIAVGAISATAGRYLEPIFTGSASLGMRQRATRGAISEGLLQEGPQESVEQIASNIARMIYDGDLEALDGVMESYVQGAVVGAPGGAFAGAVGGRSEDPNAPEVTPPPTPARARALPFSEVFGEGGENPFIQPDEGPEVPADVAAAVTAAIRSDAKMDDMITNIETFAAQQGQQNMDLRGGGMNSTERGVEPVPGAPTGPGGQQQLPLQQRQRGVPPQDVRLPGEQAPNIPQQGTDVPNMGTVPTEQQGDMFNPIPLGQAQPAAAPAPTPDTQAGFGQTPLEGFAVTMRDDDGNVIVEDVFGTAEEANDYADKLHDDFPDGNIRVTTVKGERPVIPARETANQEQPDAPSAEPMGDIQAQLADLEDTESDREGVFLSADNLARLQRDDLRDQIGEVGVHLVNFDGKGGLLIAQDQEIADSAVELRDAGFPMQMIIGQLTQAGLGKPPAEGSAVVQLRDANGNVIRESLLPEDEAYALADKMGDMAVVLSPQQAQKRRQQLIAQEQETSRQQRAIRETLPLEERGEVQQAIRQGRTPKTASKAAANVIGLAVKKSKAERERSIGGFFPPDALDFKGAANEKAYRELFGKLLDNQLQQETAGTYPINRKADLKKEAAQLFEKLGKVRQLERPTRKTTRVVKAALAIDKSAVSTSTRDMSKKAEKVDTSDKDYFAGEQFKPMDREQIDALSDTDLTSAFAEAAYWLAGQFRNVEITPEWLAENYEAAQEAAGELGETIQGAQGDPFVALAREYDTPGKQRKLLRRASAIYPAREYGGKSKSLPVTIKGTKTELDTGVLTQQGVPQDESRADEIKRKKRASDARKELGTAVRQSGKLILRLENPRSAFGKAYAETDPDTGAETDIASKARTAKAYFVALNQLALSLIESTNQSADSSTAIEKLSSRLREIAKLSPNEFATQVARMARADEAKSLRAIADPAVREQVTNPKTRVRTIGEYFDTLRRNLANRDRMENRWKKNAYYNNLVGPLMRKFSDSIATTGWASYRPTEAEMVYLEHAMHGWRTDETTRKDFYDPLKRFFRGVGMEFETEKSKGAGGDLIIPKDKDGNYAWSSNDEALHQKLKAMSSAQMASEYEITFTDPAELRPDAINAQMARRLVDREAADTRADARADAEQAAKIKAVNRTINAFLRVVNNPKSTIQKLVKAEQKLVKRMKEEGVWEDTPSPSMGKIRLGTVRTYRRIGLPLLQKKISKADARASMAKLKPYPMPDGLPQETFTRTQAEKELELKMGVIDSVGNAPELKATAAAVGDLLVDRTANTNMNQVLDAMLQHLPQNHVYRALAEKLRALGLADVPVKFDYTGKLDTELGSFKTVTDKFGSSRIILINNRKLIKERELGNDIDARVVHVLLHEMVHAATHKALRSNPGLRNLILKLREAALPSFDLQKLPYGLQEFTDNSGNELADEFVAEAFTNLEFQNQLKKIILDGQSAWKRFLVAIRDMLGFPDTAPVSVLDVILSLESELFKGANLQTAGGNLTLNMDGAAASHVSQVVDRITNTSSQLKRIWSMPNPPLVAMTMEQIRDVYGKYFGGSTGPLRQYMSAFFQRNARNTELMSEAEKLTRQWTKLNEEAGTAGEAFSTLATEATLNQVAANFPLSHDANSHLESVEQQAKHRELHKQFNAMTPAYQKLYNDIQSYYREALNRETSLMTLNALRGLLTKGEDRAMTKAEFNKKYTESGIRAFDSKEKMDAEFGQYFSTETRKEMMATLSQMANIRQQRRGNYFPIKRYGNYVVSAEREVQRRSFDDRKEAFGYAAERRATDATLVVNTKPKGDGWEVTVIEKEFTMAETRTKAEADRQRMIAEYGEDAVTPVQLKTPKTKGSAIESNQALGSILKSLSGNPAAQAAIKQFYLESLSDSSFRKHEMRRKNRKGADSTLQLRNFTTYAKQSAYYTAQLEYGHKMADGIQEMNDYIREHRDESDISAVRLGEVRDEIVKRDEMQVDPDEILTGVRKAVEYTQFAMLTSPSYWMINASQPWMVTLPWLNSRYGMGRSLAAMKNAQSLIISPLVRAMRDSKGGLSALRSKVAAENAFNVLDDVLDNIKKRDPAKYPEYKKMLEELRRNNVIDLSWIAELRDISEGTNTGMWQKTLDASRIMAHLTEVNNRILTAVATYDLAKQEAMDNKSVSPDAHVAYATQMAQQAVSETQFNYSSPNKPRLFQAGGPLGKFSPMVFQFMQWPQHMYALMIKNIHQSVKGGTDAEKAQARKLLLGLFGTHLAAGGILGAALQPVKWAIGLTMFAFGDDDDTFANAVSGESFDRLVTRATVDLFGSEIGGVLAKGLPTAVGADLSARMSLGTVYFIDFKSDNAESALGSLALGLGGASVNLAANTWRGLQDIAQGDLLRGIERGSPKILRDVLRTGRYWNEGLVNNAGDTVIRGDGLGARDLFLQALGVQPYSVSQFYQGQQAIKDTERYYRDRKSDILKAFRTASTPDERAEVLRNVADFNRNNPALAITRSALIQSVTSKYEREARYQRYGANIDEKAATQFAKEGDPYR